MLVQIVSVLALLQFNAQSALGAVALGSAETHPDHPNSCYVSKTDEVHEVDSEWPMETGCGRIRCVGDQNSGLFLTYETCGTVHVEPPCEVESNLQLPYPRCCPQPKCPERASNIISQDINDEPEVIVVQYDTSLEDQESEFEEIPRNQYPFLLNPNMMPR